MQTGFSPREPQSDRSLLFARLGIAALLSSISVFFLVSMFAIVGIGIDAPPSVAISLEAFVALLFSSIAALAAAPIPSFVLGGDASPPLIGRAAAAAYPVLVSRCPACGEPTLDAHPCAVCELPLSVRRSGYQVETTNPLTTTATVGIFASVVALGVFLFASLVIGGEHRTLAIIGFGALAFVCLAIGLGGVCFSAPIAFDSMRGLGRVAARRNVDDAARLVRLSTHGVARPNEWVRLEGRTSILSVIEPCEDDHLAPRRELDDEQRGVFDLVLALYEHDLARIGRQTAITWTLDGTTPSDAPPADRSFTFDVAIALAIDSPPQWAKRALAAFEALELDSPISIRSLWRALDRDAWAREELAAIRTELPPREGVAREIEEAVVDALVGAVLS